MRFPIIILIAAAIVSATAHAKDVGVNLNKPKATLADVEWGKIVNGVEFDEEDLVGKVVVVEEWGVNCPPCLESMPELAKMAKKYEKAGLRVIGLECQESSPAEIKKFLKFAKVTYPVMSGGKAPGSEDYIPYICVFNVKGKMVYSGSPDEEFEKAVKRALKDVEPEEVEEEEAEEE